MTRFPWTEKFKVDTSAFTDSPTALRQLILSGDIPEEDYFKWASEEYKLAILSKDFFKTKYNNDFFKNWNRDFWSPTFFPIHYWRGVLYIACLEPQKVDLETPYCLVLCSPKTTQLVWTDLQSQALQQKQVDKIKSPMSAVATTEQKPLAEPIPQAQVNNEPAKNELDFSSLGVKSPPDVTMTETVLQSKEKPKEEEPSFEVPEGSLNFELQTNTTVPKLPPKLKKNIRTPEAKKEALNVNPRVLKDNKMDVREITQVLNLPKVPTANPSVDKDSSKAKGKELTFTTTKTIMPFPDRTTQFTFMRTVYSQQLILEASSDIIDGKDPQEALMSSFRTLRPYFEKLMWVVRDNKGYVLPIACDSNWLFEEAAWTQPLDFKTKNPFRIAKYTQKPFHGPVSRNIASDLFFKLWNEGQYPEHMTVVPVVLNEKVFGYFIGCGKGEHFESSESLSIMESVCRELLSAFVKMHGTLDQEAG